MASEPIRSPLNILFIYGSSVLFFLFVAILCASTGFLFGIPITSYHFLLSVFITLFFIWVSCSLFSYRTKPFDFLIVLFLLTLSFYLFFEIGRSFFDISDDGQGYHQEALIQLSRGWNPFSHLLDASEANRLDRWLNHYSKGVWFYEAILFRFSQDLEAAKLFHLWLMTAAFSITLSSLSRFAVLPVWVAFLASLLAAFNPVSIYQSLSFYLDGQLMSLMVILLAILGMIFHGPSRHYHYFLLFMVLSVLVNVKLTAGIYGMMILAGYVGLLWWAKQMGRLRKVVMVAAASLIFGFFFFGYSPYVTNTLHRGNPFYPALGTDRSDYTLPQFPRNFYGKSSPHLLFYSIFSKSDNKRGLEKKAHLKIPFTVAGDELKAFQDTNAKQGGFGPLFGGTILVSFLIIGGALGYFAVRSRVEKSSISRHALLVLFCMGILLATCLINPASSLARFIPQMWLFPIFTVFLCYIFNNRVARMISPFILLLLALNNGLVAYAYFKYNSEITEVYNQRLGKMASERIEDPHKIYFGYYQTGNTWRFDRLGINYQVVADKEACKQGVRILPNSILMKCDSHDRSTI